MKWILGKYLTLLYLSTLLYNEDFLTLPYFREGEQVLAMR